MVTDSHNTLPINFQLGEYRIESVLGHGGFGITYLARDTQLGTQVAIKEYYPNAWCQRDAEWGVQTRYYIDTAARESFELGRQQFLTEARTLAQFKHHNIVRVLRFLEANGTAYMVMEYEAGQGLARQLKMRGNRLDEPAMMRIFIPILNGLHAVHVAGLLHRDIKPANIYLRADGSPMLIDFGSVRQNKKSENKDQLIALTPAYAAIEQYPNHGEQGPWTDIYAMGASMYRCITGITPKGGFERYDAIRQYQNDPLKPLVEIQPDGYSNYLLRCVDWAMQIYARNRPKSARDLQESLMGNRKPRVQTNPEEEDPQTVASEPDEDSPVDARPKSWDTWKLVRWSVAALLILGIAGTGLTWWQQQQAKDSDKPFIDTVVENRTTTPPPSATGEIRLTLKRRLMDSQVSLYAVAFIAGSGHLVASAVGGDLIVWRLKNGKVQRTLNKHRHTVHALAPLSKPGQVAAADNGGNILLWDITKGRVIDRLIGHRGAVTALALAPNGRWLASGGRDQRVVIWNLGPEGDNRMLTKEGGRISSLRFSPDGRWLAVGTATGEINIVNTRNGKRAMKLGATQSAVQTLAFSPDGRWLASAGLTNEINIWNIEDGDIAHKLMQMETGTVQAVTFSSDGQWLFSGHSSGALTVWNVASGRLHTTLAEHQGSIRDLALSPDGKQLASSSRDHSVILWSIR